MTSEIIFFTLGFWVELPQILGLGFSVWGWRIEINQEKRCYLSSEFTVQIISDMAIGKIKRQVD